MFIYSFEHSGALFSVTILRARSLIRTFFYYCKTAENAAPHLRCPNGEWSHYEQASESTIPLMARGTTPLMASCASNSSERRDYGSNIAL